MEYDDDSLLALSGIQHFAFCPRQWALIHVEQQWKESISTAEGRIMHKKVHGRLVTEARGDILFTRSLPLVSRRLGLYGVADTVEFLRVSDGKEGILLPGRTGPWQPRPIEYKRGKPKTDDRDEVQLCAQALCLEEMLGIALSIGSLFYGKIRRRVEIRFDDKLRERVKTLSNQMHHAYNEGITPAPPKGVKCNLCSLEEICLPKLVRKKKSVDQSIKSWIKI